eukprot:2164107-Rhodomonas_salina.1
MSRPSRTVTRTLLVGTNTDSVEHAPMMMTGYPCGSTPRQAAGDAADASVRHLTAPEREFLLANATSPSTLPGVVSVPVRCNAVN